MACRCVGIVVRTSSRGSTLSVIFRRGAAPRDGRTRQLIFPQAYHWGQLRDPLPSWIRILSRYNYPHQRNLQQLSLPCLRLQTSTLARFLPLRRPGLSHTWSALSWLLMCPPSPRTGFASLVSRKPSRSFVASVASVVSGWPTSAVPSFTTGQYIRPSMRSSTPLRQQTVNVSVILCLLVLSVVLW